MSVRLFIDPGHGGSDPGAIGPTGLKEKDVTLSVSMILLDLLEYNGFGVIPSRTVDRDALLLERSNMANVARADLVVSVHCNSSTSSSAKYVANYVVGRGGNAEKAARVIQEELRKATGWIGPDTPDGVIVANLHMVREPNASAVIVELGFISNPGQEKQLRDPAFHRVLAEAIARGICRHFGVTYKQKVPPAATPGEVVEVYAGDNVYAGMLIDGKTYVHVRAVEEFGLPVLWDGATKTVYVGDVKKKPRLEHFADCDVITASGDQVAVTVVKGHLAQDGINGGYLDGGLNPLGLAVIDGKQVSGPVAGKPPRSVFGIDNNGIAQIFYRNESTTGLRYALGAGPGLIPIWDEGFQDDIVKSVRERSAVGVTADGLVKLVATAPMSMEKLATTMINLGCIRAMNLDGGGSSHLRFGGETIRGGGRAISTAIILR